MAEKSASKKVQLDHNITINGVTYASGTQDVPVEVAEDLVRINNDYNKSLAQLNRNNGQNVALGKIAGGGN